MRVLPFAYLTAGLVSIFFTILFAISVGVVDIPFAEVIALLGEHSGMLKGMTISSAHHDILWELRLPRVLLAGFAGAGLSLCGMVMQALVQNPLAEPYILGVASGASLGAVAVILLGGTAFLAGIGVPLGAFIGAVAATGFVLALAGKERSASAVRLILAGAVVSALFSALANLVVYLANDAEGMQREVSIADLNGRLVLVDDSMPVDTSGSAPVYTTYVLGDGAIEYTDCGAKVPYEMDRNPATNGGQDLLYSRQRKCWAPFGISFTKASMATNSPTNAELETGANWELVKSAGSTTKYIDHKTIPIARIISLG